MATHGEFEHQLKIGDTTQNFRLVRDDNKQAMYSIENFVPAYRNPLTFTQSSWVGGHGQYTMRVPDKYFEGQSIDTTQDGRFFLGPLINTVLESDDTALDSAVVKFIWFPYVSKWICATAGKIYIYGTKWTAATTTVAGVTDLCVFGNYLFAACGASTAYKYSQDGDNWTTVTTLADLYAIYFFVAPNSDGTAEVLWKAVTNELKSNTSGLLGSGVEWASAAYIGDTSTNITNVFAVQDNLMDGKTDGLWWYASDGRIHQYRPDLAKNISTDNYKYVTEWSGAVYHSEINGMGEMASRNSYEAMGPLHNIENIGKRGSIVGLASDKDFLYVAIDEGTNTHIYKGREIWRDGIGLRWEWCPWIYLGTYTTATLATCQHSTTDRRLWFGYKGVTAEIDMGVAAVDKDDTASATNTRVMATNPANYTGSITSIDVWAATNITGLRVGTFYSNGNNLKCRDSAALSNVTAGSKTTITTNSAGSSLYISVVAGDYLGCYYATGTLEATTSGTGVTYLVSGEYIDAGDETAYTTAAATSLSLYATGEIFKTAYVILSDNPTADPASTFCTSGFLKMSYDYGTDAKWDKMWQSAVIEQRRYASGVETAASSGETVALKYRDDTDLPSADATSIIAAYNTAGVVESNFTSAITNKRVSFELWLASDTSTATPEVSYFQVKGIEKPTTTRIHEMVYAIGDEPTSAAKTLRDLLRTARTSTTLIKFSDLRYLGVGSQATAGTAGTDYVYCVLEPGYPQEIEVIHRGKGTTPELGMRVRMREVNYS